MRKKKLKNKHNIVVIIVITIILILIAIASIYAVSISKNNKTIQTIGEMIENESIENIENIENIEETENSIETTTNEVNNEIREENKNVNKNENNTNQNKTNYYIKINNAANVVTIYTKDTEGNYNVPVKAMVCSTGSATPQSGKYKLNGTKHSWGVLFGNVYGQYTTAIVGNILFHSVPYTKYRDPSSLEYWEYDKLGTKASAGCIRLTVEDAKWIYNNISKGTVVEFYSDSNPGPLGKPSSQKISGNTECRGWDPTDTDSRNPWKNISNKKEEQNTIKQNDVTIENKNVIEDKNEITNENKVNEIKNNITEKNNNIINSNSILNNTIVNNIITNNTTINNTIVNNIINNITK